MNEKDGGKYSEMSVRDFYISQVMIGLYSSEFYKNKNFATLARIASIQADAMLSRRHNKPNGK